MKKFKKFIKYILLAVLIGIQFLPVERTNPPVEEEISAPKEVHSILKRSCYDCHSNLTKWPWYSYVAPISMKVAADVKYARKKVNFTTWNEYDEKKRKDILEEIDEEVTDERMPMSIYVPFHPEAKLSENDRALISEWVAQETEKE